jgi:uncharacterized protein (TIGR02145 family)
MKISLVAAQLSFLLLFSFNQYNFLDILDCEKKADISIASKTKFQFPFLNFTDALYPTNGDAFEVVNLFNTVTDIDSNVYNTIKIGSQVWMQENLKTSKYNDGTPIPTGLSEEDWANTNSGSYTIHPKITTNKFNYGNLYNWHAINTGKLCPIGWHVPSQTEWSILIDFLGGDDVAGGKMKSSEEWIKYPEIISSNYSGFTGLPGGMRWHHGSYGAFGYYGYWWSSTEYDFDFAWFIPLDNYNNRVIKKNINKENGMSCRCVKD